MTLHAAPTELLRRGAPNPGSLRPAEKDRASGVSSFETETAMQNALATTASPIQPGETYVVLDTSRFWGVVVVQDETIEGHWLICPADAAEMDTWIRDRPTHRLTEVPQAAIIRPVRKVR